MTTMKSFSLCSAFYVMYEIQADEMTAMASNRSKTNSPLISTQSRQVKQCCGVEEGPRGLSKSVWVSVGHPDQLLKIGLLLETDTDLKPHMHNHRQSDTHPNTSSAAKKRAHRSSAWARDRLMLQPQRDGVPL